MWVIPYIVSKNKNTKIYNNNNIDKYVLTAGQPAKLLVTQQCTHARLAYQTNQRLMASSTTANNQQAASNSQ